MVNTSFGRFSSLAVLLVLVVQAIWIGANWMGAMWSNIGFYRPISGECILVCHTEPVIHTDVLEYVNPCMTFVHTDNSELQSKIEAPLRQLVLNAAKFEVECDSRGFEKSFRFTEEFNNQESTYLVMVINTLNCSVVRLENFCDFMDKTTLFNKTELPKKEP